ncbi:MAG TPA: DUF3291 domain-containing protein [Sphingomicrobium sp.]|nr:DUF3291 domain-containing protein [Sphingomicrobium sp.]
MSDTWRLAQINIGKLIAPQGDPRVQPFFDALDEVNALAEASPGFVWRLTGEGNDATDIRPSVDPLLLMNMSVWEDAESLFEFVYRSSHTPVMSKRRDWYERFEGSYMALWWIPAGTIPTINDGLSRLWHLDRFGPTPHAFTFKARFPAPGIATGPVDMQPDPWCVGNA